MLTIFRRLVILLSLIALLAVPIQASAAERIVSLYGDITEIIFGLGLGDQIVAVDASSVYPVEKTKDIPNLGFPGRLSVERVLAFEPTLVIANSDAGPPEVFKQLEAAGVRVFITSPEVTLETPINNIRTIANLLGVPEQGEAMVKELRGKIEAATARGGELKTKPRVMFLYLASARFHFAAGANTASNVMIEAAGAIDAGAAIGLVGNAPYTPEAVVAAQPEVLILTERSMATAGGIDGLLKIPGIAQTPAGQNRRVIVFEDLYFLGMGPRSGDALMELADHLHQSR